MSATSKPVESITIVGGGTAGWLAANLLSNYLGTGDDDGTNCRITLIESPNIATVGVGEATVPAMPRMLRQTGISEREFFKATNASFKLGVRFANWNHDAGRQAHRLYQPVHRQPRHRRHPAGTLLSYLRSRRDELCPGHLGDAPVRRALQRPPRAGKEGIRERQHALCLSSGCREVRRDAARSLRQTRC